MTIEIPEGYAQCVAHMSSTLASGEVICTFGMTTPVVGQLVADGIRDVWSDTVMPVVSASIKFERMEVRFGADGGGSLVYESVANLLGTQSAAIAPINCSNLVQKRSSSAGRTNRGRMFLPGVLEASVGGDGLLTGPRLAQLQTAMSAFLVNLNEDAGGVMVVLHNSAQAPTVVTSMIVAPKIATQRQRMRD